LRHSGFNIYAPTFLIEAYNTVHQCEDGVIPTKADISARQKFCSTLTDNNVARDDLLAAKFLDAEPFTDAITPVLNASLTLLMRHRLKNPMKIKSLYINRLDPHSSQLPPMADGPMVTLAASVLERDHLFIFKLFYDLAGDLGPFDERRSSRKTVAVAMQDNLFERYLLTGRSGELFDRNGISRANPILFTSRTNDCVCHGDLPRKARNISQEVVFHN
jgi:hypothetical protein